MKRIPETMQPTKINDLQGFEATLDGMAHMPGLYSPEEKPHPFVYFITLTNQSDEPMRIVARKWVIEEVTGETSVIEARGVAAQEPLLFPGESFTFNSYHSVAATAIASASFVAQKCDGTLGLTQLASFEMDINAPGGCFPD